MNVTNINSYSVDPITNPFSVASQYIPELNIICIYDGILTIQDNSTLAQIGIVSKEDALNAPIRYDVSYDGLQNMYGGNFFTKVRDWFKNKALPWVKEHGPQLAAAAKAAAPLVGLGQGVVGGRALPRRRVKARLHRL